MGLSSPGLLLISGSPVAGNLAEWSDVNAIGPGDLSGHVVTAGGLVTAIQSGVVTEAMQSLADVTTGNVSIANHGYAPKAPNDSAKFLDGTGAYSTPPGAPAPLVLQEAHTASSSANLTFASWYSSLYDEYLIEIINLVPATDNVILFGRFSTDGGATYDGDPAGHYLSQFYFWSSTGAAADGDNPPGSGILLAGNTRKVSSTASRGGLSGTYRFFNPGSTTAWKQWVGQGTYYSVGDAQALGHVLCCTYMITSHVNAFQIYAGSGNLASGTVRVYGIAKV